MWSKVVSEQIFEAVENVTPVLFMSAIKARTNLRFQNNKVIILKRKWK